MLGQLVRAFGVKSRPRRVAEPWRGVQRKRYLIPLSGFWEPEKLARALGNAPWSYYSMRNGRLFMAGLGRTRRTRTRARSRTATRW